MKKTEKAGAGAPAFSLMTPKFPTVKAILSYQNLPKPPLPGYDLCDTIIVRLG
jgi:hypothetical protein